MSLEKILNHYSENIYYQTIDEIYDGHEGFKDVINHNLSDNFKVLEKGIYVNFVNSECTLPVQGWKIHISSNVYNADEILNIVSQLAVSEKFTFKCMKNRSILLLSTHKAYPRNQAGKFITIYTSDNEHFCKVIDKLYDNLNKFDGPYILTDKRYRDCKVLYYRYGAYTDVYALNKKNEYDLCIIGKNGELLLDKREFCYSQPDFISSPFSDINHEQEAYSYLFSNYSDIEPIRFTNSGGVYTAYKGNNKVVIKEARPHTCVSITDKVDSIFRRKKEVEFLNKFIGSYVPKVIDCFHEWEHFFLVEEYIDGETLRSFCVSNNPFVDQRNVNNREVLENYIIKIIEILNQIIDFLFQTHREGYVISDISSENIMISGNQVKFIDLESVFHIESPYVDIMTTTKVDLDKAKESVYNIDYEALSYVFYDFFMQRSYLKKYGENYLRKYLENIVDTFFINESVVILWEKLGQFKSYKDLDEIKHIINDIRMKPVILKKEKNKQKFENLSEYIDTTNRTIYKELSNMVLREKQIISSDCIIDFGSGYSGILYYLQQIKEINIEKYENWLLKYSSDFLNDNIGLLNGMSGTALALMKNKGIQAEKIITDIGEKIKYDDSINLSYSSGLAGYGCVLIKIWFKTKKQEYLDKALSVAKYLLETSYENESGNIFWSNNGKKIGLFHGNSGISLFFVYLYCATGDEKYILYGEKILDYDLENAVYSNGVLLGFPKIEGEKIVMPYIEYGTSGILMAVLRIYAVSKKEKYREWIQKLYPAINIKYSVLPGYFDGLSGIGHAILDMHHYFKDEDYKVDINDVLEGISLLKVKVNNTIFYPSEKNEKVSYSLGDGVCGILSLYHRFFYGTDNLIMICDEVLKDFIGD